MAKNQLFLLLLAAGSVVVASSATPPTTSNSTAPSPAAYEMLGKFGFPPGILPQGVQSYVLNENGSFSVSLPGDCVIDGFVFTLRYRSRIHGNIKAMLIDGLDGVSVNLAFKWEGINSVERSGGKRLEFKAGVMSQPFPADIFAVSPRCNYS